MKKFTVLICFYWLTFGSAFAQKINSDSAASIVEALQEEIKKSPSIFPLESYSGGIQTVADGLRLTYFGYGERRYTYRSDFHPAMDVAYVPKEIGYVTNELGESWQVRAPKTYLKKVYAIRTGELVSIKLLGSGYKIVLKHKLERPYFDNDGNPYHHYYTCYRHLDSRSLEYLTGVAKEFTNDPDATYEALFGKYTFEAGQQIALVGFPPNEKAVEIPRSHLDFSLNLFKNPDKGTNIRNYALNPLLLFPPFEYTDPRTYEIGSEQPPAYTFITKDSEIRTPSKKENGGFVLKILSGGLNADGGFLLSKYFALKGMDVVLMNDGEQLASFSLDRHLKLGYDTKSYDALDNPDQSNPYFLPPIGEQSDIFIMLVVLPKTWFKDNKYNWRKDGSVSIKISSIWDGYLEGHNHSLTIPISTK